MMTEYLKGFEHPDVQRAVNRLRELDDTCTPLLHAGLSDSPAILTAAHVRTLRDLVDQFDPTLNR